jgi:hypothetical protein
MGHRLIGKKPGESQQYDAYMERHGRMFKFGGLAVMAISLFLMLKAIFFDAP